MKYVLVVVAVAVDGVDHRKKGGQKSPRRTEEASAERARPSREPMMGSSEHIYDT